MNTKIIVLGSSSAGNGYIIGDDHEQLILECGVPFKEAEKALDFHVSNVVGCCITHEHGDHCGRINEYITHFPVYATTGTLKAANILQHPNAHPIAYMRLTKIGNFNVLAFKTQHDADEPCGFLVQLPDKSKLLFATDTYYLHYTFKDIDHWLLECNYDEGILRQNVASGEVHPNVAQRVRKAHMSLAQCIKTLQANDLSQMKEIILIHLSSQNSERKRFVDEVRKATGKLVIAANKGTEITTI